jgi:transcriptional regulator with XRE-family HTH domain
MVSMGRRQELGRFLRDRRARVHPADVGLPSGAGHRRVAGLRREEVATLAGVGVSWYTMLENGTATGVSTVTLTAIARALRLNPAETDYLCQLADERNPVAPRARPRELTSGALAAIEWAPAYICTSQWIALAWNRAMSLVWNIEPPGGEPFNIVERMFEDAAMRAMHGDRFEQFSRALVAMVRAGAGRRIDDPEYRRMSERLQHDPIFRTAWDGYDVAAPLGSIPTVVHSVAVGTFSYDALTLVVPDDDGHSIVVQVPDAPSAERLRKALTA